MAITTDLRFCEVCLHPLLGRRVRFRRADRPRSGTSRVSGEVVRGPRAGPEPPREARTQNVQVTAFLLVRTGLEDDASERAWSSDPQVDQSRWVYR